MPNIHRFVCKLRRCTYTALLRRRGRLLSVRQHRCRLCFLVSCRAQTAFAWVLTCSQPSSRGCYHLGAEGLFNPWISKAALGCQDGWISRDRFDPTADLRQLFKQFFNSRANYRSLNDGFSLVQRGDWTHGDHLRLRDREGLCSVSRSGLQPLQNFTLNDTVWFLYTNENSMMTYSGDCTEESGISGPYQTNTVARNLLHPSDNYALGTSNRPYPGCIESITMQPRDFKSLAPAASRVQPAPTRIVVTSDSSNPNSTEVQIEFSDLMNCNSVSQSMNSTLVSSGKGATVSRWYRKGTIEDVADGVLTITTNSPTSQSGVPTGVSHLFIARFTVSILTNFRACMIRRSTTFSFRRARATTLWSSPTQTTTRRRFLRAAMISSSLAVRSELRS